MLESLEVEHGRIERAAQIVKETIEVGGQRHPSEVVRARHVT
jgi:hypothetical protein